ncbi:MAG TPA: response regulator [bacterium]|nr:response regulator [bacterium]
MTQPLNPPWKVLIVDDDPTVHKLITKKLSSETYQVQSVFDAPSALSEVDRVKPDLVILDLMMPRTSGIEVCKAIKGNQKTRDVMVLILSAKESQDDRIRGLELGADDYISKPFHLAALTRKIEYMLAKRNSMTEI